MTDERRGYEDGWEARNIGRPFSYYLGFSASPIYLHAWERGWEACDAEHRKREEAA